MDGLGTHHFFVDSGEDRTVPKIASVRVLSLNVFQVNDHSLELGLEGGA